MSFMRKFLDLLNMDNWKKADDKKECEPVEIKQETHQIEVQEKCGQVEVIEGKKESPVPKRKKVIPREDFDAFLWQCNSIAELRSSENVENQYTELDNPDDNLEVGYREALLHLSDDLKTAGIAEKTDDM